MGGDGRIIFLRRYENLVVNETVVAVQRDQGVVFTPVGTADGIFVSATLTVFFRTPVLRFVVFDVVVVRDAGRCVQPVSELSGQGQTADDGLFGVVDVGVHKVVQRILQTEQRAAGAFGIGYHAFPSAVIDVVVAEPFKVGIAGQVGRGLVHETRTVRVAVHTVCIQRIGV